MVLEVCESARRPKCHITASLRHARRLPAHGLLSLPSLLRASLLTGIKRNQAARICPYAPQSAPECPWLVHTQNGRFPAPGARLSALGDPTATYEWVPHGRFFASTKTPSRTALCPPKTKMKSPGGIELTTTRRPQQITMGSKWDDGLNRSATGAIAVPSAAESRPRASPLAQSVARTYTRRARRAQRCAWRARHAP